MIFAGDAFEKRFQRKGELIFQAYQTTHANLLHASLLVIAQYALNPNENIKNPKGTINRTPNRRTREKMFIFRGENRVFVTN